jgi:hypothetical protein
VYYNPENILPSRYEIFEKKNYPIRVPALLKTLLFILATPFENGQYVFFTFEAILKPSYKRILQLLKFSLKAKT